MKLTAIIEIPQGSLFKYEVDKIDGMLSVDRQLNQPIPYNYGYIPETLCDDGDPLDIFIIGDSPIYPLSKVKVNILRVLKCLDNGKSDDKIIASLDGDSDWTNIPGISIISSYLTSYKAGFKILNLGDREEAIKVYEDSVKAYNEHILKIKKLSNDTLSVKW